MTSAWTAGILPTGLGGAIVPLEHYPVWELYFSDSEESIDHTEENHQGDPDLPRVD